MQDRSQRPFVISLSKQSSEYVRFKRSGSLYEFLCLCFGLGPAPKVFNQLLRIPVSLFRRINIQIIVCLDDMSLKGRTLQETVTARNPVIFLSQNLGFVINLKKSVLQPVKKLEFLGLQIDTEEMTLSLSEEKLTLLLSKTLFFKNQQVNLALSVVLWDHNYCRIFINEIECPNRQMQIVLRLNVSICFPLSVCL